MKEKDIINTIKERINRYEKLAAPEKNIIDGYNTVIFVGNVEDGITVGIDHEKHLFRWHNETPFFFTKESAERICKKAVFEVDGKREKAFPIHYKSWYCVQLLKLRNLLKNIEEFSASAH